MVLLAGNLSDQLQNCDILAKNIAVQLSFLCGIVCTANKLTTNQGLCI